MSEEKQSLIDFYENHFLINGEKPPPLSSFDRKVLEAYERLKPGERLIYLKGRQQNRLAIYKCIEEKLNSEL